MRNALSLIFVMVLGGIISDSGYSRVAKSTNKHHAVEASFIRYPVYDAIREIHFSCEKDSSICFLREVVGDEETAKKSVEWKIVKDSINQYLGRARKEEQRPTRVHETATLMKWSVVVGEERFFGSIHRDAFWDATDSIFDLERKLMVYAKL